MSIQNCKITKAAVDLVSKPEGLRTVVTIETVSVRGQWTEEFVLPNDNPQVKFQLANIMDYAGVDSVQQMEGRIIREAVNETINEVIGFGNPITDEFILIGAYQKEQIFTEAEIKTLKVV